MTPLIHAELRRLFRRTFVIVAIIGIFAIQVIFLANAFRSSSPPSGAERAELQAMIDQDYEWALTYYGPDGECAKDAEASGLTAEEYDCLEIPERLTVEDYSSTATYESLARDAFDAVAVFPVLFALAVGISFVTAEYSSGSLSNWLTFAPRRTRVFFAKLVALLSATAVVSAVYLFVGAASLRLISAINGVLGDDPGIVDRQLLQRGGRWLVAALIIAVLAFALGMLVRSAALAGGIAILYAIVDPMLTNLVKGMWRVTALPRIQAWTMGEYQMYDYDACYTEDMLGQACVPPVHIITQAQGGWYLLGAAIVFTAVALMVFRRRDVA